MVSFFKNEIHGQDKEHKSYQVIQPETFIFKYKKCEEGKHYECDHLLDDFQLHQRERAAILLIPEAVGRDLGTIFKEGDAPADTDDSHKAELLKALHFSEFEMPIPGHCHKHIRQEEKTDGEESARHKDGLGGEEIRR